MLTSLRVAAERFAVDEDRVFVAGTGKGVPAAVAAGHTSPQRFAGVIGWAGDAGELGPENFLNLPTLFAGGAAKARAFRDKAVELGLDQVFTAEVHLTDMGANHLALIMAKTILLGGHALLDR